MRSGDGGPAALVRRWDLVAARMCTQGLAAGNGGGGTPLPRHTREGGGGLQESWNAETGTGDGALGQAPGLALIRRLMGWAGHSGVHRQ